MKKRYVVMLSVVVLALFSMQALAQDYDKDAVVKIMRANGAAMKVVTDALAAEDFFTAATKLMEIAQNMIALDAFTPVKGSKEEWDKNHHDLAKAAFKGIGACGEEDAEKVKMYFGEVGALLKEGHGMFK